MRVRTCALVLASLALGALAGCAATGELTFPSIPPDAGRTADSADVDLGRFTLWLASSFMDEKDPETAEVKRLLRKLKSVRVRSYEIPGDGTVAATKIAQLRRQLSQPEWTPLVRTHDRKEGEDVDVYLAQDGRVVRGLAIITSSPHEITVVNAVGSIDLDEVERLSRTFAHSHGEHSPAQPTGSTAD